MRTIHPGIMVLAAALLACNKDKGVDDTGTAVDPWEFPAVLPGVANLDDDNGNGAPDWDDAGAADDNDLSTFTVPPAIMDSLGDGDSLSLELVVAQGAIRVWQDGAIALDDSGTITLTGDTVLFEFADMLDHGDITLTHNNGDGDTVDSGSFAIWSSPLFLTHHLWTAEWVTAMDQGGGAWGNRAFIDGFEDGLGSMFESVGGSPYSYDPWIQDEIEFAALTADGIRLDIVIDSIRSSSGRYLDDFAEDILEGKDTIVKTWGRGSPTSQDSFGNLEASPPVTVDGVEYPLGRIYYGKWNSYQPHDDLIEVLEDQKVQDPFMLDVSFLCVGHVDEFTSWIPDPDYPLGYYLMVSDTELGYDFLNSMDSGYALPKYAQGHGYSSVGEILDDQGLRLLNEDIQAEYIEPNIATMKAELGLTDADIVRVPSVFEEYPGCWGSTLALIPGTVNMQVSTNVDGTTKLFLPDPFFRGSGESQDVDPFIEEFANYLPAGVEQHWIDDWNSYHLAMGEVHCGSNTKRTPAVEWWNSAMHLLGGE